MCGRRPSSSTLPQGSPEFPRFLKGVRPHQGWRCDSARGLYIKTPTKVLIQEPCPLVLQERLTVQSSKLSWKWRGALNKIAILYIELSISFHVNLGEGSPPACAGPWPPCRAGHLASDLPSRSASARQPRGQSVAGRSRIPNRYTKHIATYIYIYIIDMYICIYKAHVYTVDICICSSLVGTFRGSRHIYSSQAK